MGDAAVRPDEIELTFRPSPDEPADGAEYQGVLLEAERELRARGAAARPIEFRQDDVNAVVTHSGQWIVPLGAAAIAAVGHVAAEWLKARQGRKVKVGAVEAPTIKELEQALKLAAQHRESASGPGGAP